MPHERLTDCGFVPMEKIAALVRAVGRLYNRIFDEHDKVGVLTLRVEIRWCAKRRRIVPMWRMQEQIGDRQAFDMGDPRDSQLTIPGEGLRSDEPPDGFSDGWARGMLASVAEDAPSV